MYRELKEQPRYLLHRVCKSKRWLPRALQLRPTNQPSSLPWKCWDGLEPTTVWLLDHRCASTALVSAISAAALAATLTAAALAPTAALAAAAPLPVPEALCNRDPQLNIGVLLSLQLRRW